MRKWIKVLLWTVGVVVVLLAAVSLLAGPIAKGYVNKNGEKLTGRRISVEHVGVNLFSGNVCVRDLCVYEDDGKRAFASFDTLDVSARLLALPFKTLHLGHITLAGLKANIKQDGDHFNFSSLIDHFATDEEKEEDTTPSEWTLKFYNIRLSHASVAYDDLRNGKGIHLPDINLSVPGFVVGGDEASQGGLNIGFAEGGHLNVDADYDSQEKRYSLTASLEKFALENVRPLADDMLRIERLDGTLNAHITAKGQTDNIMQSHIGGTIAVDGVDVQGEGGSVARLTSLKVDVENINLGDNRYDIRSVTVDGLAATYDQWADHNTVSDLLVASKAADTTQSEAVEARQDTTEASDKGGKAMALRLGRLAVTNCAVTYNNHTLPEPFSFPVTNLNAEATDLTLAGGNNAKLRASLPGGGHLMVVWKGDLGDWKRHQDLFLSVKGLDMKQLSPWAVAYTGQPIEDGVFGLTTRLGIANSELDNQNKIDIYKARVGSRRKDVEPEMKIPLKTALYILKDKDDKILIDLPVKGNVDNPEFNYMKVVWKTLGNLLVKVATSPARALGNAMGLSGNDLEFIAIDPAQHGLTSEQYHQLSDLATIAHSDSLIVLTLERQMPATEDSTTQHYERFDMMVSRYLEELGVDKRQLNITTGEAVTDTKGRTGYAVSSEMRIDE